MSYSPPRKVGTMFLRTLTAKAAGVASGYNATASAAKLAVGAERT
jgi:hypothetical protein